MSEETINDLQSFPVLTSDVARTGGQGSGYANGSSLGQTVDATLREVLAWRPRPTDTGGFLAALNQAFSVSEVEGHTEWQWKPRSYSVQADLGKVTGSQASIYARARNALDQSVPLLQGLYPLRADADTQDVEAIRAIVISEFTELVNELGQEGGPRPQRIDTLFNSLLGPDPGQTRTEEVRGLLGTLRERFGLDRTRANRIESEQTLTNFFIAVEHLGSLKQSWDAQSQFFAGAGSDVFLGTQLVLLSRQLAVLSESVQEAYFVMDSVFLGPAERQTVLIPLGPDQPALTIAQLLEWIDSFAIDEGPRIIRDAGKDGVISLGLTVNKLLDLTTLARKATAQGSNGVGQRGLFTSRTNNAFAELAAHLERADQLIGQMRREPAPRITVVNPQEAVTGGRVRLTVDGSGFQEGFTVRLEREDEENLTGQLPTRVSSTQLDATFDLTGAAVGEWSVIVANPDGGVTSLPYMGTLNVTGSELLPSDSAALKVHVVSPPSGPAGAPAYKVAIYGDGFKPDAQSDFEAGIVASTTFKSSTELEVYLNIPATAAGTKDVTVTSGGKSLTLSDGFTVTGQGPNLTTITTPPPGPSTSPSVPPAGTPLAISKIDPPEGRQGETFDATITGTGFGSGTRCVCDGTGVAVGIKDHETTPTSLKVNFAIDPHASIGPCHVIVTNPVTGAKAEQRASVNFTVNERAKALDMVSVEFFDSQGRKLAETKTPHALYQFASEDVRRIRVHFNEDLSQRMVSKDSVYVIEGRGNEDEEITKRTNILGNISVKSLGSDASVVECEGNLHPGDYTLRFLRTAIQSKTGHTLAGGRNMDFKFNITVNK